MIIDPLTSSTLMSPRPLWTFLTSSGGKQAMIPDLPSRQTSRSALWSLAIMQTRAPGFAQTLRASSTAARVFPKPRPARMSQILVFSGKICFARAFACQSYLSARSSAAVSSASCCSDMIRRSGILDLGLPRFSMGCAARLSACEAARRASLTSLRGLGSRAAHSAWRASRFAASSAARRAIRWAWVSYSRIAVHDLALDHVFLGGRLDGLEARRDLCLDVCHELAALVGRHVRDLDRAAVLAGDLDLLRRVAEPDRKALILDQGLDVGRQVARAHREHVERGQLGFDLLAHTGQ